MDRVAGKAAENQEKYLTGFLLRRRGYLRRELLGQGAFSKVYLVEEEGTGRLYACKISHALELLEREALVLAQVRHPLFPEYVAFWEENGLGFLVEEYVRGRNLENALGLERFSARRTASIGLELAEGLGCLHGTARHYLFRDVKPANLLICREGGVKLVDFGCACAMDETVSARAGTPGFAAPEQLRGEEPLTPACDVYAVGRTLQAACGAWPAGYAPQAHGAGAARWTQAHPADNGAQATGVWATLGEGRARKRLLGVLADCTREDPLRRIPDMGSLRNALLPLAGG